MRGPWEGLLSEKGRWDSALFAGCAAEHSSWLEHLGCEHGKDLGCYSVLVFQT